MNRRTIDSNSILREQLQRWTEEPLLLARFFNTLSYLEHIGARKILLCKIEFGEEQLRHAAEETRHALRLKEISKVFASGRFDDYQECSLLGGHAAFNYFQRLDAMVRAFLASKHHDQPPVLNYLLVTMLVETRAATLYPILQEFIETNHLPISVKSIVADENRHLEEMNSGLSEMPDLSEADIDELSLREQEYFGSFVERICAEG